MGSDIFPVQNRQEGVDAEIEIDLREYWLLIRRHQYRILGFAAVLTLLAALVIYSLPSMYRAETTVLIEAKQTQIVPIAEAYDLGSAKTEHFNTQFEIMKSRDLAKKVIAKLHLAENPFFAGEKKPQADDVGQAQAADDQPGLLGMLAMKKKVPPSPEAIAQGIENRFLAQLTVKPLRNTQLVTLSFDSPDPKLSAEIVNELANTYIENDLEVRLDMKRQATAWLSSRMVGLRDALDTAERELQAYREKENLIEVEGVRTLAAKELNGVTERLIEARRKRVEAENIVAQMRSIGRNQSALPAVLQQSMVQRMKEQEAAAIQKLTELSKRYGPKHPKILAAQTELEAARSNANIEIAKVVEGAQNEYEIARATEDSLNETLEKLKSGMQDVNRKEYKLNELERTVEVNRQLYDTFFSRIKEQSETEDLHTAHARVVDKAEVPMSPVSPKRRLLLLISALASLFVGVALAFLKETLDNTIKTPDDVAIRIGEQLLGLLPLMKNRRHNTEAAVTYAEEQRGTFAESIRTMRTGVVLSGIDNPHKILVVTSSVPGEGKTTVSINLATAFGQLGKVLLIDADMRRPSVQKSLQLESGAGLSNLVAGTAEKEECIRHIEKLGIDVMTAGVIPPNPLELLSSQRFAHTLAELENHYDRIIIDSAPAEVVSDALVLSSYACALIYVVRADSTNTKTVKSGVGRLRAAGAPLTGLVLNQVDIDKAKYGYYYGGYYDHYGYSATSNQSGKKKKAS